MNSYDRFKKAIESAVNECSMESGSNTPDYILANYLMNCFDAFNEATQQRETWHGRDARPTLNTQAKG